MIIFFFYSESLAMKHLPAFAAQIRPYEPSSPKCAIHLPSSIQFSTHNGISYCVVVFALKVHVRESKHLPVHPQKGSPSEYVSTTITEKLTQRTPGSISS